MKQWKWKWKWNPNRVRTAERKLLLVFAAVAVLSACDIQDRSLGDAPMLGSPCEPEPLGTPQHAYGTANAAECGGDACAYAEELVAAPDPCASDSDCNPVGADQRFECHKDGDGLAGTCRVATSWVLQRSMCAPTCETNADCQSVAGDTACETGFSCAQLFAEGDLCCEKLCLCNDELPDTAAAEAACADVDACG